MTSNFDEEVLVPLQEKYGKVRKLIEEESKKDPEKEPFRSKYAAQEILNEMKDILVKVVDDLDTGHALYLRLRAMFGAVWFSMGSLSVDTEELSTGEEQLSNCVEYVSDIAVKPEAILVMLSALNQLGILWSQRDQARKSQEYLERAEQLYKDYRSQTSVLPLDIHDLFDVFGNSEQREEGNKNLEKVYTHTLYYLAQIYGSLGKPVKSAVYCHTTLKRQLESKDFDHIEWALNAATLSQFFVVKNGFR